MCGIVGVKGFEDKALLERMKDSLVHRGPDQHGSYVDGDVMLGHRRLSIIDLSEKGRQPMENEDGNIVVVFNGEIYNYKKLREELEKKGHAFVSNSDTEVLVHGYEEWGEELPAKLDGDFGFAVWDSSAKRMMLARDPVGVVPLYYRFSGGVFWFASEIKALFEYEGTPRKLSSEAFNDYFTFRYPIGPKTMFDGIFKVQPGELLVVEGDVRKKKYFSLNYGEAPWSETYAVAKARELFRESVKKRLQSDVPLGVYLSGGLDSSFVTAIASEFGEVHTFSVAFGEDDETEYVDEVVGEFNTKHTPLQVDAGFDVLGQVCWHLDEPPADIAAVPTYLMAEQTKKHATVVLTGDGGDEMFGGYSRYSNLLNLEKWRNVVKPFASASKLLPSPLAPRIEQALKAKNDWELVVAYLDVFSSEERKEWKLPAGAGFGDGSGCSGCRGFGRFGDGKGFDGCSGPACFKEPKAFLNKMMAWDVCTLLPDDYLMKVNKSSMAHGVEARVPFLDKALMEFTASMPIRFKASPSATRILQRKAMKGIVPERVVSRRKHGFNIPTKKWLGEGLKEVSAQLFDSLGNRGYFQKEKLMKFLHSYGRNESLDSRKFWAFLGFEIWHQTFLDPDKPKMVRI